MTSSASFLAPQSTYKTFDQQPFPFPELRQVNRPAGRVYEVSTGPDAGQAYPSITRVLGDAPKPQLEAWKKRVGKEEAARISTTAATKGTALHALSEAYLANLPQETYTAAVACPVPTQIIWGFLKPWVDAHVITVHGQEQNIYSTHLKVAGRFDLLAEVDSGDLAIIDFKNSRKPKKLEYVSDYFCQATYYALAVYERTGYVVKRIIVPIVSPEGLQIFESTPKNHYTELKSRISKFYATHKIENI